MVRVALALLMTPLLQAQFTIQASQSANQSLHSKDGTLQARDQTLEQLLEFAYHLETGALVAPAWMSEKTFDVDGAAVSGEKVRPALQQALVDHFRLAVSKETRPMEVYVLRASPDAEVKLASSATADNDKLSHIRGKYLSSDSIARYLSSWLGKPVINETGLLGKYTVDITWDANNSANLIPAVEHAGLHLEKDHRPVEVLVVNAPPM